MCPDVTTVSVAETFVFIKLRLSKKGRDDDRVQAEYRSELSP